jgi:phosphatidylglycerophosphate synthase
VPSPETALAAAKQPTVRDFYTVNRGGGLYSEGVSQWLGALFALVGARLRLKPTHLTLLNLVMGLSVSAAVIAAGPRVSLRLALLALLVWQLAYALDCADGQLARVTGQGSLAGARVDILADVASQIALVTALVAVGRPAHWLGAMFAGTWMVNLVTSVLATSDKAQSMVTSRSPLVRLVKLVRDYGAVVLVAGLVLVIVPGWTNWFIAAFTVVNGGFLLASIAFTARTALRAS